MIRLRDWRQRTLYERASWLAVALILVGTIAVELAAPLIAWKWTQRPFLGLLFEHTLVVSGIHSSSWGTPALPDASSRLIAIGGQTVANGRDLERLLQTLSMGERVTLMLEQADKSAPVAVETTVRPFSPKDWAIQFWLPYGVGLIYLAIGIWVFWLRGDQRPGQSFALFCASVALATGTLFDICTSHTLTRIWTAALPFTAAALMHLALVFPEEGSLIRRWPVVRLIPYPIAAILAVVSEWRLYTPGDPWAYIDTWRLSYLAMGLAGIAFFGLMLYSRSHTLSPIVRQQVRIILLGGILAFSPLLIYLALAGFAVTIHFQSGLYLPTMIIFPLSIAYAILRYRLLGLDPVIRRGLAYVILVAVSVGTYLVALTVLGRTLKIEITPGPSLLLALLILVLLFGLHPLRRGAEGLAERLLGWRRFDYRQALQAFSRELATMPLDLPAILRLLLTRLEPVSHSAQAIAFLYDPYSDHYALRRATVFFGGPEEDTRFKRDSDLSRWLGSHNQPVYLEGDDGPLAEQRLSQEERQKIEALGLVLFLPLRGQEQLQGWVGLGSRLSGEPYAPDDIAFLAALTDQTAIAVENAQFLTGARHQAEELMALQQTALDISAQQELPVLLQAVIERATRLLDATGGGIYLVEQEGQQLRLVASHNLGGDYNGMVLHRGEGLAGQIAISAQPMRADDYQQFGGRAAAYTSASFRAVVGVPLVWHDQVLGVLDVVDTRPGRTFTQKDEWLLALFGGQAAIALRNAQLFTDLEQRVVQLDALRQIGEAVDPRSRTGLDDLLDQIYRQTKRMMQADNFYVALYDERRKELSFAYYVEQGERREPATTSWPLGTGLTSQIVRQRSPIITDDYLAECRRRGVPASGTPGKAWLGMPLIASNQVLGVINISSFQPDYRYAPEQVQIMQAIADQAASAIERTGLYQEMQARAAELATLNEVSQTINSTLDLGNVLSLIMNKVVEILQVEAGSLLLLDEESGDLVFQVALGGPGSETLAGHRHPQGKGIVGHVAQSGKAEIVNDVQADPRWNRDLDKETGLATRSILCVPMLSRDRVIGVIEAINHRDGTPFQQGEANLLIAFAAQAAVAIENARLYTLTDQALARRVEELSTMQRIDRELNTALDFDHVMDMTLEWALRGTGATVGVIGMYDAGRQGMLLLASRGLAAEDERHRAEPWPLDRGIAGRVIRTGEASLLNDVSQDPDYYPARADTRSQLTVPIRREDAVIGVIDVESPQLGAFNEESLAFILRLADHAATAIENARLYRASQRWAEEMTLLYNIGLTVSAHLALDDVLEAVYARIRDVWQPSVFFIALYDQGEDALDFVIYVDRGERLAPFRHLLTERPGFSAWIVRNRQPLLIHDWEAESAASPIQGIPVGQLTRSWLGVPLLVGDQMVGVMAVQDYAPNAFGEEHERFLSTIASEVAISIENARLYQETQQRLRELGSLFDTSAALSTTLDVEEVLKIIARQVTDTLGADGCTISTWDREQDALVAMLDYSADPGYTAPDMPGTVYPLANYPASRQVLQDRRPLAVRGSDPNADPAEVRLMQEQDLKYLLMVPMIVRDDTVGLLELIQIHEERAFSPTEIGLVQTMANQAAAALENARLYEGVKQANQAKSEFIDFVAHELKQPMTSMQGYARMLTMGIGGEMTAMQKQFVQVITSNVDRMGKLVNDLLEISRLEAGRTKLKLTPVHLGEVVDETLTNTRTEIEARQHTLEVSTPDDLPPVMGDRERLVQILTNLVSNAYKYTPNGGTIRIAVDGRDNALAPPGYLLVSVSDTGIGMSPEELAGLEEKFFRADHPLVREQPGTGLGVSITRGLVALHGGELIIESEAGKGSTFSFTVPVAS